MPCTGGGGLIGTLSIKANEPSVPDDMSTNAYVPIKPKVKKKFDGVWKLYILRAYGDRTFEAQKLRDTMNLKSNDDLLFVLFGIRNSILISNSKADQNIKIDWLFYLIVYRVLRESSAIGDWKKKLEWTYLEYGMENFTLKKFNETQFPIMGLSSTVSKNEQFLLCSFFSKLQNWRE